MGVLGIVAAWPLAHPDPCELDAEATKDFPQALSHRCQEMPVRITPGMGQRPHDGQMMLVTGQADDCLVRDGMEHFVDRSD